MILFVCSECSFFIKTGGLADVLASLPNEVNKSMKCSVVLPFYKKIKEENEMEFICSKYILFQNKKTYVGIFKKEIDNITYFFIDNNDFFDFNEIYGFNDFHRFSFFNIAILENIDVFGDVDIIHCNDWHSGLIGYLIKYKYFLNIKTIYTIHNIQYQGIFNNDLPELITINFPLKLNDKINFMKCGIENADIITTVSNTYRNETLCYEYGYYLEDILKARENDYIGIVNGLDIDKYNPLTDINIYKNYNTIEGKIINKKYFCNEFNLNNNMLCGLVSRLCDQKGIELILDSLDEIILNTSINFFLMGSGDKFYEEKLLYFNQKYPTRVLIHIGYNEQLAQKLYASCDVLLIPSKFEPCGLSQLIAMRYGTLPLVRETGGLKDTVEPYNKFLTTGTGFSFKNFNCSDFKEVLYIAYDLFSNKVIWNTLIDNAMKKDSSFENSCKKYLEIYENLRG